MTASTEIKFQRYTPSLGKRLAICAIFWSITLVIYALSGPIDSFTASIINIRSEYTVAEQLSKYYLLIIIFVSIFSYSTLGEKMPVRLSLGFLILGLTLYLAESNMINNNTQPIFGVIVLSPIFYWLYKTRAWLTAGLLIVGFGIISTGVLVDFVHESSTVRSFLTQPAIEFFSSLREEMLDVSGLSFICLAVILLFWQPIRQFFTGNLPGTLGILVSAGIIAIGNGLLHYGYRPSETFKFAALVITALGFGGLVATNMLITPPNSRITLVTQDTFYIFMFSFFVVLPTIFSRPSPMVSLVLWLPTLLLLALYLDYRHPLKQQKRDNL